MKTYTSLFTLCIYLLSSNVIASESPIADGNNSMYDIPITTLDGKKITLSDYIGKKPGQDHYKSRLRN